MTALWSVLWVLLAIMAFVLAVLVLFAIVAVLFPYSGVDKLKRRAFEEEFRKRGAEWEDVCRALDRGEGFLIIDHAFGPAWLLGEPTVWWNPQTPGGALRDLAAQEVAMMILERQVLFTNCPSDLASYELLRARFCPGQVVENRMLITQHVELR